jgi:octaprenyl-diphosphate synthase
MATYGRHLGTAFQLVDDILDYTADAATMGKEVGDDLAEGKPTLPLLYAMWHGSAAQAELIRHAIEHGGQRHKLADVMQAMQDTGAIEYAERKAVEETEKAVAALASVPDSDYKTALVALANEAIKRVA